MFDDKNILRNFRCHFKMKKSYEYFFNIYKTKDNIVRNTSEETFDLYLDD